ncbi:molybdate ABC transporter substrate-binding protein [Tropicimonas sp. IMCC6043]|uniref:molybdate ABC transporter substrate-binding protein n=1 Tax=Tropicimonas sp. IMCC6043 TaxID=2510645 RepID=UPI00101C792C|nr:molybdate ABC transporter substrate-binding protein [Tropicimonas sp. IMCC6043]RYH11752.1 molybdate ABC transporter substrate-binding protein [Tropicimonas sp. IMCC6043]
MKHFPKVALLALVMSAAPARAEDLLIFAAASLTEALQEAASAWESQTGHRVTLSFAGSSTLARQIEAGAPADLFLSANETWMDRLEDDGLLRPGSRQDLLSNRLVLIANDLQAAPLDFTAPDAIASRLGEGRLAMALVEAVPAGIYGKAALMSLGLWEDVAPQVAQADNVRAALALVASGEAPLGIVYATDAMAEPRVTVIGTFPEETHMPIRYPMAIPAESHSPEAGSFAAWLAGPEAAAVFRAHGFGLAGRGEE